MSNNTITIIQVAGAVLLALSFRKNIRKRSAVQLIGLATMIAVAVFLLAGLFSGPSDSLVDTLFMIQAAGVVFLIIGFWKCIRELKPVQLVSLAMMLIASVPAFMSLLEGFAGRI